ncbi:MAG TPA: insulinase family protein, partial [Bacteroidales bacterium]|nr:insulinase family protein [Bacteroidales bacterium]
GGTVKIISKRSYQTHCVVGGRAYSFYDKRRLPLALLTNILGGPALNSKLNQILREKHALAYTIDASYTPFTDTGVFSVYFGTDKSSLDKCISLVTKEFNLLKEKEISPGKLKAAKKQLLGQLAISMDNAEAQCLNIGKSLLVFNKVEPIGELRRKIEEITAHEIFEAANDIFSEDNLITLIYK